MNLTPFGIFQLLDFVGGVENLCRLAVDSLSCGRLIVDETSYSALVTCLHRDDQPAIADGKF